MSFIFCTGTGAFVLIFNCLIPLIFGIPNANSHNNKKNPSETLFQKCLRMEGADSEPFWLMITLDKAAVLKCMNQMHEKLGTASSTPPPEDPPNRRSFKRHPVENSTTSTNNKKNPDDSLSQKCMRKENLSPKHFLYLNDMEQGQVIGCMNEVHRQVTVLLDKEK